MIEVNYPGKLFIMGEYAIMEPGNTAVIISVNRYLNAKINKSDSIYIQSEYGILTENNLFKTQEMPHVQAAVQAAFDYLDIKNVKHEKFSMIIESELSNSKNEKYGFGSSGVVIVAVLDAILKLHNTIIDEITLFKLAVVVQYRLKDLSSGGDLAATIYKGLIAYTRYELKEVSEDVECVFKAWHYLNIERIPNPFNILVGWTGQSHDTNIALRRFKEMKIEDPQIYKAYIVEANDLVLKFLETDLNLEMIAMYRVWMLKLENWLNYEIEIKPLTTLIEIANQFDWRAKVSGSGGGDCGIALSLLTNDQDKIIELWTNSGIDIIQEAI